MCVRSRGAALAADAPAVAAFANTGLERSAALAKDVEWLAREKGLVAAPATGAGAEYAKVLRGLSATDPPAFLCHWYNVYFAHSGAPRVGRAPRALTRAQRAAA